MTLPLRRVGRWLATIAGVLLLVAGGAALVFESGTYYLSQRALRYRAGAEGRQPLTEEVMRDAGSTMLLVGAANAQPAIFRLDLETRPGPWQSAGRLSAVIQPFVNGRTPL